jgi:DNA mismatch repair protein PMS2
MSTHSKNDLKSNITEIFGLSSMNNMVKLVQCEPDEDTMVEFKLKAAPKKPNNETFDDSVSEKSEESNEINEPSTNYADLLQIEGYISNCTHNSGRGAPDRQYIYINKRPCDHSRVTKLINEVYHQYNRNQYPMYVFNFKMNSQNVDVNVTPDKLQVKRQLTKFASFFLKLNLNIIFCKDVH